MGASSSRTRLIGASTAWGGILVSGAAVLFSHPNKRYGTISYKGISFLGLLRSGKTTCASFIEEAGLAKKISFADALRDELATLLALSLVPIANVQREKARIIAEMRDPSKKKRYREALQWYGTEWRRWDNPDYWVNTFVNNTRAFLDENPTLRVVNDDTRFLNEGDACRGLGLYLVRIVRPSLEEEDETGILAHPSETEGLSIEVDETIYNDGTLEDLRAFTLALASRILNRDE